jgi:four helix bundle protein
MAQPDKDLIVWQEAADLVKVVYDATDAVPKREIYSLTDQIRRAAVSIPSNIAERQAHCSNREFPHFLRHSRGSLAEPQTQVIIAQRRNYRSDSPAADILKGSDEVSRIPSGLINSLKEKA